MGEGERAARLLGAAEAQNAAIGARLAPTARAVYEKALAATRAGLGEERFAAAWAAGQGLQFEQAISYAVGDE